MNKLIEINRSKKYVFDTPLGTPPHANPETINTHIKRLGFVGRQNGNGWKDVVVYRQQID